MTLILTVLARDEIDIIASVLDHHLNEGIDHVIVTDNGSQDGTRDVLARYERAGVATIIDEPGVDFRQGVWVTRMAQMAAARFSADWVINTDADEFFLCRDRSLREALDARRDADVLKVAARHDFVTLALAHEAAVPVEMRVRKRESLNPMSGKPIAAKAIHRGVADVVVTQGCHDATGARLKRRAPAPEICTFHYPVRTYEQFESKVRHTGLGYNLNTDLPKTMGQRKKHWYDLWQRGLLREEFTRAFFHDAAAIASGLASGELIEESVLADRFRAMKPRIE